MADREKKSPDSQPESSPIEQGPTVAIDRPPSLLSGAARGVGAGLLQRKLDRRAIERIQRRADEADRTDEGAVRDAAALGTSEAGGALPHRDQIQRSFGKHDISKVQAHTGGAATAGAEAMGAEAFATGNHVAFAGAPSLHTAAHEAAHVIQQRAGVHLKGGVGEAGDAHEQHADAVADRVVRGQSSEALLDPYAGGGGVTGVQAKLEATRATLGERAGAPSWHSSKLYDRIFKLLDRYHSYARHDSQGGQQGELAILSEIRNACLAWVEQKGRRTDKEHRREVIEDFVRHDVEQEIELQQHHELAEGKKQRDLGKGQVGATTIASFGSEEMVFKPDERGYHDAPAATASQIPNELGSLLSNRAVAASRLERLAGFNALVRTEFASQKDQSGQVKKGIAMEKAPGESAQSLEQADGGMPIVFKRPDVVKLDDPGQQKDLSLQLSALQVLDAIIGQVNRHAGNYFIQRDGDGHVTVKGIDNDFSFGKAKSALTEVSPQDKHQGLPCYIEDTVAAKVQALDAARVEKLLGRMLAPAEVQATLTRLGEVKQKIAEMTDSGHVLSREAWNAEVVAAAKSDLNGYYGQLAGGFEEVRATRPELMLPSGGSPEERRAREKTYKEAFMLVNSIRSVASVDRKKPTFTAGLASRQELFTKLDQALRDLRALNPETRAAFTREAEELLAVLRNELGLPDAPPSTT